MKICYNSLNKSLMFSLSIPLAEDGLEGNVIS